MRALATSRVEGEAIRFVICGQAAFLATILACCAIEPSWPAIQTGLSYYGNDMTTIPPYVAGFVTSIGLTAAGLRRLPGSARRVRRFRTGVALILALMVPIPLTPYRADVIVDWLHYAAAGTLFTAGLVLGGWLVFHCVGDRASACLFGAQILAGAAVVSAQAGLNDFMLPSELAFQLVLVALVVHAIRVLSSSEEPGCA
ncbi:MAG TPA: hypothetical protein VGM80_03325 [Gaiellaceae bacterium]